MAFIDDIMARAKADKKTIVLPESMDKRTFEAAEKIIKADMANIIIIGTPEEIAKNSEGFDITGATIVDPFNDPNKQKYIDKFIELRGVDTMVAAAKKKAEKKGLSEEETQAEIEKAQKKGITPEAAQAQMESDYMYYACLMCKCGDADGAVSGFFLMDVPDCDLGEHGLFIFADCAVNTDVDSAKLAEIAMLSAESFEQFIGAPAKVAMLSYSSYGSAKHDDVTKVAEAVKIAKEKYPDLVVDGELQLDAALVEEVGQLKAPGSPVAGHANTLVFPSLEAGNIGYKLVQRLAKAPAYGPVLQGLALPVNDLSRGCNADDIVGTVAITAVQAQAQG